MRPRDFCPRGHDNASEGTRTTRGKCKACQRIADQNRQGTSARMASRRKYWNGPAAKATKQRYNATPRGRKMGRLQDARWKASLAGQLYEVRWRMKRRMTNKIALINELEAILGVPHTEAVVSPELEKMFNALA